MFDYIHFLLYLEKKAAAVTVTYFLLSKLHKITLVSNNVNWELGNQSEAQVAQKLKATTLHNSNSFC